MTSPCCRVVDLLADYLEDQLPPALHADLERHLSRCPACVAHVRGYRATVSLLRSLSDRDLPEELRLSLHAFLDGRTTN